MQRPPGKELTGIVCSPPSSNSVFEASGFLEVAKSTPPSLIYPARTCPLVTPPPPLQ